MKEIRLPQHVVKQMERQWAASLGQSEEAWQRADRPPEVGAGHAPRRRSTANRRERHLS
jgi:hypothetical protein